MPPVWDIDMSPWTWRTYTQPRNLELQEQVPLSFTETKAVYKTSSLQSSVTGNLEDSGP